MKAKPGKKTKSDEQLSAITHEILSSCSGLLFSPYSQKPSRTECPIHHDWQCAVIDRYATNQRWALRVLANRITRSRTGRRGLDAVGRDRYVFIRLPI